MHCPDLSFLEGLASSAGEVILRNFNNSGKTIWKSDETPLTATDTAINAMVIEAVQHKYPHVGVFAEEGNHDVEGAEYVIACDPVDGTFMFASGVPVMTFCICVIHAGVPITAVIFDPFTGRMTSAEKGKGGKGLHYRPLRVSPLDSLKRAHICVPYWKGASFHLHDVTAKLMDEGAVVQNIYSLAYFGGLIASGDFHGTIFPGKSALETAAMKVVVEEAGGKVTDIYGKPITFGPKLEMNGSIVSNGLIHDKLVEIIVSCQ